MRPLVDALKRRGWTVWWDREIVPGADFARRIEAAIAAARCVVVVWTETSVNSTWVQSEAHEGLERRNLVPVMLEPVTLPLAFRHKDAAQLFPWSGDEGHPEFQRLLGGIEATLSGIPSPSDAPFRPLQVPSSGPRFGLVVAFVLVLAIGLAVITWLWRARDGNPAPPAAPPNSIAVLRLANLAAPSDTYRSDGLSLEILSLLTRVKELVVASQTSAFALAADTTDIGERLGVRYFLEGSFNRTGDDVTVDLRLVDAGTHHVVWSERLTRSTDALIDIPFEAARGIVTTIDIAPSEESLRQLDFKPTASSAALDEYLRGNELLRAPADTETLSEAEKSFRQAISLDSAYAMPYAGLCRVYLTRYERSFDAADFARAEDNCRRTLSLNALQADPHKALGGLYLASGRLDEAEAEFAVARRLSRRDGEATIGLADVADRRGDAVKAERFYRDAIALEPLYWRTHASLGRFLFGHGRYPDAVGAFKLAVELDSGHAGVYESMGGAYYMNGAFDEALAAWQKALALKPGATGYSNVGTAYFFLHRYDDAAQMYERAIQVAPKDHRWWGHLGDARRFAGQREDAMRAYEHAALLARENLAVDPSDAETRIRLALYDAQLGRVSLARQALDETLGLTPDDLYLYYDAAVAYASLGMADQSLKALATAVKKGYPRRLVAADPQFDAVRGTDEYETAVR